MAWKDTADRTLRIAISAFKTPATYRQGIAQGLPIPLVGVFDKPHESVDPETGAPVASTRPTFGIARGDLPADPTAGDLIEIEDVNYKVVDSIEDGQAGITLVLHRVG